MDNPVSTLGLMDINPDLWVENDFGERYLRDVNTWSFDTVSAQSLFEERFGEQLWQKESLHIIVGTDSGLLLDFLQNNDEKGLAEGSRYLFIELPALCDMAEAKIHEANRELIAVCHEENWLEAFKAFFGPEYLMLNSVHQHTAISVVASGIAEYARLYTDVSHKLDELKLEANVAKSGLGFHQTNFQNLAELVQPFFPLKGAFAGKTAFVLGAGPSVDRVFDWIKAHRDQVVVLSVSRICERLHQVGIVPDFIFTVDPQDISYYVSRGIFHFEKQSVLAFQYHASPLIASQWLGKKVYIGHRLPFNTDLNLDNSKGCGPTVSHSAIYSAIFMGFSRVLLAGVDLCFSSEGYSHAEGNTERKMGPALGNGLITVKTNLGDCASTNQGYYHGIDALEQLASLADQLDCQILNTSGDAVAADKVGYQPLESFDTTELVSIEKDFIENLLPDSGEQQLAYFDDALAALSQAGDELKEMQSVARRARVLVKRFFGSEKHANAATRKKIDKLEKQLEKDKSNLFYFSKSINLENIFKIYKYSLSKSGEPLSDSASEQLSEDDEKKNVEKYLVDYYTNLEAAFERAEKFLASGRRAVEARKSEVDRSASVEEVAQFWLKNRSPRRMLQAYSSEQTWQEVIEQQCPELAERLSEQLKKLEEFDSATLLQVTHSEKSYEQVLGKLQLAFSSQQIDEIKLLNGYLTHAEWEQKAAHQSLAQAMIAELEGDSDLAMSHLQSVIEDPYPRVINEALLHVAVLSINHNKANDLLMALQCLTQLHVRYAVPYAEALSLLGLTDDAQDTFEKYFAQFPEDKVALMRYMKMLQRLGKTTEAAKIENQLSDLALKREVGQCFS